MNKKFPEPDPNFYLKCRAAAISDFQRGIVFILEATGMHLACLMSLKPNQMNSNGDISWHRTKTSRPMRARIPMADRMTVRAWIGKYGSNKRSVSSVQKTLKKVGTRAGFPDLSPMTFRAQRAVRLLDEREPYHEVAHLMGCSPHVLMANYAQLKEDRKVDQGYRSPALSEPLGAERSPGSPRIFERTPTAMDPIHDCDTCGYDGEPGLDPDTPEECDTCKDYSLWRPSTEEPEESCDNCGIDACMKRGTEGIKWCDEWTTLIEELE